MTRTLAVLGGLFLVSASLGGCAGRAVAVGPLQGTQWQFVTIDGARAVSEQARLGFLKDAISASAGCNSMGGNWRIEGDRLIAGPLMQTEMYCEGPVWVQEQAVSALLVSAPQFSLSGARLTLKSSGHSAELVRRVTER